MNEPVRIIADWLADVTHGVNAVLATLTIDVGDTRPSGVVIADATRDEDVAVGRAPDLASGSYALSVSYGGTDDLRPESTGTNYDGRCTILIRYDGRHSSAKAAQVAAGYVLRATYRSLNALWAESTARTRNGVELVGPNTLTITPVQPRVDTDPVLAGLLLQCEIRDATP